MINAFWEYLITQERLAEIVFYKPDWFSAGIYKGMIFLLLFLCLLALTTLVLLLAKENLSEKREEV